MNLGSLILSNGTQLNGNLYNFNHQQIHGEVVFNTGMTGYEETLTDPSYAGQILVFTYPLLGNYGASDGSHFESEHIHVKAVVCTNLINNHIHHNAVHSFLDWLKKHNIPLIDGIDTRELTKILRDNGTMDGIITTMDSANISIPKEDINWVKQVSTTEIKYHGNGKYKLIVVDFGVKQNIIHSLLKFDVSIKQVPYNYDYSNEEYDGILLSNGPGDPKQCVDSIQILKKVLNKDKPIFGICLGSQLMGLAAGADTYKLKFGHRGQNQPCQDIMTNHCYLTSQNHGYAICNNTLPDNWEVTFKHLHDNSIAGIRHKNKPFSAVQFHPEASAGPHDTEYLFAEFMDKVSKGSI